MKLLITGGHITPALAFVDNMLEQKRLKPANIVFVGRKYISAKSKEHSFEYDEIQRRKIRFVHLVTGRFSRILSLTSLVNLLLIPGGFIRAWTIISKEKPYAILSFGGYLALPIACVAALRRIPVYTHEQTITPGLTNKIIARFARKVFVSFPQTKPYFPPRKTVVTGDPVRQDIFKVDKAAFTINKNLPVIYVTGASIGSHAINMHIEKLLTELLREYIIIHQTGNVSQFKDYDRLSSLKDTLPAELKKNYYLAAHFSTEQIGHIFTLADLVVSRAGANTVIELIALKKPAILIPLPWSGQKEQELQAKLFAEAGTGEVFHQNDSSEKLQDLISMMISNIDDYKSHFDKLDKFYNPHASETIAKNILL